MTPQMLSGALGIPLARAQMWAQPITDAMAAYKIDTPHRQAAFLAQIGHESGCLRWVREHGSHAYLDKYDTGRLAERLGNTPEDDDDGQKYRGRGLIQITGRRNYLLCGLALELDLLKYPELLEQPTFAAKSAAWFWFNNHINALADRGDFEAITRRINGGLNGYDDRLLLWASCKNALGVA